MIKIQIRTGTKWDCAEAAGSSNFNKGSLSSILQAPASLSVLHPHFVHITALCHPSHLALSASAGHFSLPHSPCLLIAACALASVAAYVHVLSRQASGKLKEKCVWLCMRQMLTARRVHLL